MNIYIPNIKLPKDEPGAFQVIVLYVGADGKLRAECNGTHEVTVVPPHGRLGDLDALEVDNGWLDNKDGTQTHIQFVYANDIINTPTIIPASEEVFDKYTDTAGNFHWCGTHSGEHTIKAEEGE